jgi:hypothetical protein
LPGGISEQMVTVVIQWMGLNPEGRNINHTIDILTMPTEGMTYNILYTLFVCQSD